MAMDPSWVAEKEEREPRKAPIGVRATPTIQTSARTKLKRGQCKLLLEYCKGK